MKRPIGVTRRIVGRLRDEVLAHVGVGQRIPSLRSLAERFGVGCTTVQQAASVLVREGLLQARHGAGYFVTEPVPRQHVGVLLELDLAMPNVSRFWPQVVQAVRCGLRAQGYRCRLYAGHQWPHEPEREPCPDWVEDVADDRLRGVIVVWSGVTSEIENLRRRSIPIVGPDRWYPTSVQLDYEGLVSTAVRRLLSEGRRRLAFMEWAPGADIGCRSMLSKVFTDELALRGLTANEKWMKSDLHPEAIGAGWEEFREIWTADREKPDGLIVADDMLSLGAAQAIQELGIRVPDQLRVVTHGNKGSGLRYPFPVSVLECDPDECAGAMVDLMVRQLRKEPLSHTVTTIPFRWEGFGSAKNVEQRGTTCARTHG